MAHPAAPHVLWIGGPPASGKTTLAKRIARRHGLRWYNADTHTWEHRDRAIAAGNPAAIRWERMTADERWLEPTPAEIAELTIDAERGPMILDDVRRLPASPLIVAEGSPLRPQLIAGEPEARSRSLWLAPTPELLRARLEARATRGDVSDPRRAQDTAIRRALLDAAEIEGQARACGLPVLVADGSRGVDETVAAAEAVFAEALAAGPGAETAAERRALLRYANEAVVSQCLAYLARPWAGGDAESMVRAFVCECDDPECDAVIELSVAAFTRLAQTGAAPVLAVGHRGGVASTRRT